MKKSAAILVPLTALSLVVLAQAPSPAPAPDKPQAAAEGGAKRGQAGERGRWSGGGAGGMDGQFGVDRFMGALAHGQELGKKLNLTPEQQELINRLVLEQRSKMMEFQGEAAEGGPDGGGRGNQQGAHRACQGADPAPA
jgi:Spy/CpxP family protein refolding chaperone